MIAGADEQARTADLLITNQLLYQLSYVGTLDFTKFSHRLESCRPRLALIWPTRMQGRGAHLASTQPLSTLEDVVHDRSPGLLATFDGVGVDRQGR